MTMAKKLLQKIWHDPAVRTALFVFALTRSLVFAIFIMGTNVSMVETGRTFGKEPQDIRIALQGSKIIDRLRQLATRGDGGWYMHIAEWKYEKVPFEPTKAHNWAFFPLFPILWRLAAKVTGGFFFTGIVLTNVFFFFALIMLHKTATAFDADKPTADRTVFYIAAYPLSYFFSLPLSESLFLLISASAFYAAKRDSWWAAGILGALASATRLTGVFLLPALLVLQWQTNRSLKPDRRTLALLLIPLGLLAFMVHLHYRTGNAFAFMDVMAAWGRNPAPPWVPFLDYLRHPLEISFRWDFRLLNFAAALMGLVCGVVLVKKRQWALATFTLLCVLAPLSSSLLQSLARYMMGIFPIFMVLGAAGKSPRVDQSIRAIFLVLLGLMTAFCTVIVTLALS